jgi:hypothetical protein
MIFGIVGSLFLSVALTFLVIGSGSARATGSNVPKPIPATTVAPVAAPEFDPRLLEGSVAILGGGSSAKRTPAQA